MKAISILTVEEDPFEPVICQVNGPWRPGGGHLPAQCCGLPADQVYRCEQIAPPGHRCRVGEHTILHDRMGNGRTCAEVERRLKNGGGLHGWLTGAPIGDLGP